MFVRNAVLATNLGVHVKIGRENALVWVTSLDRGAPVAGAEVAVNDCRGRRLWASKTDANSIAKGGPGAGRRRRVPGRRRLLRHGARQR